MSVTTSFPSTRRRFPRKRRGVILFVVTVVITALALGGMSLLALMRVERESTRQRLRELDLTNVGRSAVVLIQALGEIPKERRDQFGGIYDNPNLFCDREILSELEGGDGATFTILSPRLEEGRSGVRYGLVNESTRLNLGALLEWDRAEPGLGREILIKLPGMTPVMADSLLDWIDADENQRPDGAEAPYYASHRLTYSPRNALPISLDELLLVRGMTRYQLYGTDVNFNYADAATDEGNSSRRRRSESKTIGSLRTDRRNTIGMTGGVADATDTGSDALDVTIPWSRLLTVFSAERDVDPNGRPRIDLNEKNLSFLFDELTTGVGEEIAAFVILCRQYGLTPSAGEGTPPPSGANAQSPTDLHRNEIDFSIPARFEFQTPLDIIGATVQIPGPPNTPPKTISSPISDQRRSVTDLFRYLDFASVGSSAILVGRINVNEAPRSVLELIPDLTEEVVTRIMNARPAAGRPVLRERRHAAWLYSDGIVDLTTMKRLWPKLTTGGDVFRAQIVAFSGATGACRRGEVVVDATVTPSRQVFYKDLTMFGRGFSLSVLMNRMGTDRSLNAELDQLLHRQISETTPFGGMENAELSEDPFENVDGIMGEEGR